MLGDFCFIACMSAQLVYLDVVAKDFDSFGNLKYASIYEFDFVNEFKLIYVLLGASDTRIA